LLPISISDASKDGNMPNEAVVRACRVSTRTAERLNQLAAELGIRPSQVDRQALDFVAELANKRRRGEDLKHFFSRVTTEKGRPPGRTRAPAIRRRRDR
jgi:hypothetical protein